MGILIQDPMEASLGVTCWYSERTAPLPPPQIKGFINFTWLIPKLIKWECRILVLVPGKSPAWDNWAANEGGPSAGLP